MNTKTLKFSILVLLVAVVGGINPIQLRAGDASQPAEKKETSAKKPTVLPFQGKVKSVDQTARTIAVGERVFQITPETKITRDDQPATLADAVAGDKVAGAYRKADDGKLHVTMIRLGVETEKDKAKNKKAETKKEM
jgi:hypothetical protein